MPIDQQLAIAHYHFGHYGNTASTMKVALWAGAGCGTVWLVTNRVLKVLCSERFCKSAFRWTSEEAKETAKTWTGGMSCPAWHIGWLMVDGTLVPLFKHPTFYGNTWFDHKSNYSMNVQVNFKKFIAGRLSQLRLDTDCQHQTFKSLIIVLDFLVVNMIPQHGKKPILHKNMQVF